MANRRMFSIKIIDSAKFLKMPVSTQALYFHLGMRADDDGIVEAFNVLRMTGATEDDLKVLVAKEYVTVLNDDLVTYVCDWKEHNKIRADRKVDSIYKNLLLQVNPEIKLIEPRKRADIKKKDNGQQMDVQMTEMDGIGKDRLGKDRLGKVSIDKDNNKSLSLFEELGFGTINSVILADIELLEKEYTEMWVVEALKEANDQGIRNLKYVKGILKNWKSKGFKAEKPKQSKGKANGFNNFEGRDYKTGYAGETYESLEKKLLGWDD